MIQFSKTPNFSTQLKFNLDGSTTSAMSQSFTSPQVIFMQKLSQTPMISQTERPKVSLQPLTDRLKFAQQLAKMDARSCIENQKLIHKQQVLTKQKSYDKKAKVSDKTKSRVKLHQPLYNHKNTAVQAGLKSLYLLFHLITKLVIVHVNLRQKMHVFQLLTSNTQ